MNTHVLNSSSRVMLYVYFPALLSFFFGCKWKCTGFDRHKTIMNKASFCKQSRLWKVFWNLILHQIKWPARVFVSFSHSMNYHTALCCSRIHGKRLQLTSYLFINPTRKQLPRVSRWPSTGGIVTFIHRILSLPVRANKQTEAVRMVSSPGKAWSMGWGFDGIERSRPHWPEQNHHEF